MIAKVEPWKPLFSPNFAVGFWVGIDGFNNGQVLQAGVSALVMTKWFFRWGLFWPHRLVNWWLWTEWFPKDAANIYNFPFEPGQTLSFVVCAPQPGDVGSVFIANLSTGPGTSVRVDPPEGITSQGDSAEWIDERRGDRLAKFDPVIFNECWAGGPRHIFDLSDAVDNELNITSNISGDLSTTQISLPHSVLVTWKAQE